MSIGNETSLKCSHCGSKDFLIEKTAIASAEYKNGRKVTDFPSYRIAQKTLICDYCYKETIL